jgi:uncharacterized protein
MKRFLLVSILSIPALMTLAQPAIPELHGRRIHDEANVLSPDFIDRLEYYLKTGEDSTSNQVGVLIIPSLDGYPEEDYTLKVAEAWKLGQKGKDNGVLLFVAVNDKKVRIEVGYGLEGVLTDALCSQIIRNELAPYFRQGNYELGIAAAVQAITKAIRGEYKADLKSSRGRKNEKGSLLPFLIVAGVIFLISIMRGGGRRGGGRSGGGWSSRGGWIPPVGGGFFGGGFGGGGGGGGGFGGFSGGGGGFGGGGSSGSW